MASKKSTNKNIKEENSLENKYFKVSLDTFLYNAGIVGFIQVLEEALDNKKNEKYFYYKRQDLFIKKEFIEYNKEVSKIIIYYDDLDLPEQSRKSKFIFSNYGFVYIYNEHFPDVARGSNSLTIEMKKLKPYIKKDSIYRYLFD